MARLAFGKGTLGPLELGSPRKAKSFPNLCVLGRGWCKGVQSAVETEVLTGASITLEHGGPGGHTGSSSACQRPARPGGGSSWQSLIVHQYYVLPLGDPHFKGSSEQPQQQLMAQQLFKQLGR